MSLLDDVLTSATEPFTVSRREAGEYDPLDSNRFTPGAESTEVVTLSVQSLGETLARTTEGDSSSGTIDVWATLADLDSVGWTALQVAPPQYTKGPPGDQITWLGRVFEISREEPHDGEGPLIDPFRRYIGTELRAAP